MIDKRIDIVKRTCEICKDNHELLIRQMNIDKYVCSWCFERRRGEDRRRSTKERRQFNGDRREPQPSGSDLSHRVV